MQSHCAAIRRRVTREKALRLKEREDTKLVLSRRLQVSRSALSRRFHVRCPGGFSATRVLGPASPARTPQAELRVAGPKAARAAAVVASQMSSQGPSTRRAKEMPVRVHREVLQPRIARKRTSVGTNKSHPFECSQFSRRIGRRLRSSRQWSESLARKTRRRSRAAVSRLPLEGRAEGPSRSGWVQCKETMLCP